MLIFYALRRINDQFSTGKSLSEVVVAVTDQFQCQSLRNKRTKALTACAVAFYRIRYLLPDRPDIVLVISDPKIVPNARSVFLTSISILRFCARFKRRASSLCQKHLLIQRLLQLEIIDLLRIKRYLFAFSGIRIV